jgi:hypothetical protein
MRLADARSIPSEAFNTTRRHPHASIRDFHVLEDVRLKGVWTAEMTRFTHGRHASFQSPGRTGDGSPARCSCLQVAALWVESRSLLAATQKPGLQVHAGILGLLHRAMIV